MDTVCSFLFHTHMKRLIVLLFIVFSYITLEAQPRTFSATMYRQFKPATVTLIDGRTLKMSLANVFLKNSHLLYMSSTGQVMEANMDNIREVKFEDRHYVRIDSMLAYVVDTIGNNKLYCVTRLDLESYQAQLRNNQQITNLDLSFNSSQLSTTTIDLTTEDDMKFPVIDWFFYYYNGKIIRVHEREIWRNLPKDKRRIYKTIISQPNFSWTKKESLVELLKAIQ